MSPSEHLRLDGAMNSSIPLSQSVPGFGGTYADAVRVAWIETILNVVSVALVVFDTVISIEQEIRLVWHGHWGVPSWTHVLNRYGTVIVFSLNLVSVLDYKLEPGPCYSWNLFSGWTIPIMLLIVEATLTMRVVALYGNSLRFKIGLWTWYLVATASMLAVNGISLHGSIAVPSPAPPILGCKIGGSTFSPYWALWLPPLILEVTLALLTLVMAMHHYRLLENTPLLYVLVRDGFFYFFVVFILMLLNVVVCLTLNELYMGWFSEISVGLASIMAARLVPLIAMNMIVLNMGSRSFLNLRQTAYPMHGGDVTVDELADCKGKGKAGSEPSTVWRSGLRSDFARS